MKSTYVVEMECEPMGPDDDFPYKTIKEFTLDFTEYKETVEELREIMKECRRIFSTDTNTRMEKTYQFCVYEKGTKYKLAKPEIYFNGSKDTGGVHLSDPLSDIYYTNQSEVDNLIISRMTNAFRYSSSR